MSGTLLSNMSSNPKTRKGLEAHGVEGVIMHLLSDTQASELLGYDKLVTVCAFAKLNGCPGPCLVNQGRGKMSTVRMGRLRRTQMWLEERDRFMSELRRELGNLVKRAAKKGLKAVARLDGTSDLGLAEKLAPEFPAITFYDYTKVPTRPARIARAHARGELSNYSVLFSRGAGNDTDALAELAAGRNVTVVFRTPSRRKGPLPAVWNGREVIDGDTHDLRFLDPQGVVVGLRAKGTAIRDTSGFVEELN